MSEQSLPIFDRTLQKTNLWLGDVMAELAARTATARTRRCGPHSTRCATG